MDTADLAARSRARPRFSPELEDIQLRVPPGKVLGSPLGLARAPNGDLLVLHQTDQAYDLSDPKQLPNVARFSPDGEFIMAFGGPGDAPKVDGATQWPNGCEGIECDAEGVIWIFGYMSGDHAVLKYSPSGEFLMRFGQRERCLGDEDTTTLGGTTGCFHDVENREVFFADGYKNHRVIAFNSDTGEFTRMWGAYGKKPWELSKEEGYGNPVHKVVRGPDGHVYVCDRIKNRIQEFELEPGGVRYLREVVIAPGTAGYGTTFDIGFSPGDEFMFVCDGTNNRIWTLDRASLSILGWTNANMTFEGEDNLPALATLVHRFFVEKSGDILFACPMRGLKRMRYLGVS